MKRIVFIFLFILIFVSGCTKTRKIEIDEDSLSRLKNIYQKGEVEVDFDSWLSSFASYEISYSDNYTYIIGSVDTNINIFSYETFEVVDNFWVIDSIKTNYRLYDTPSLTNLTIEYGDNDHWFINGHDTNIEIIYRDLTITFNSNGVQIKELIDESVTLKELSKYTLPTISSNQYIFVGWSINNNPDYPINGEIEIKSNLNLYAVWSHPYLDLELNELDQYVVKGLKYDTPVIDIPEIFNGKSITTISASAFSEKEIIRRINIPISVDSVPNYAFKNIYNAEISVASLAQTLNWSDKWRDDSAITLICRNKDKDDYYKIDDELYELSDYFKESNSGQIPVVTNSDSSFNREFYYWSNGVTSSQSFSENGMLVSITKEGSEMSSYILQVNDLKKTKPLYVGVKYTISFKIKPNKSGTKIGVSLHKDNNSLEYYYKEYNLEYNIFNDITFTFTAEDAALFLKLYLGKYKAIYTIKDFKISVNYIDYIKSEIGYSIPNPIYKTFNLKEFNDPKLNVIYETSYTNIKDNNLFDYIDPNGKENILIKAIIKLDGKTYYSEYNRQVKSPITRIPEIHITLTDSNKISDTDEYTSMSLSFIEYDVNDAQITSISSATGGIRLRGNSTKGFPKKPYRIKFDSKQSFFGLDKAKSWVLLANHADQSLMRNYLAFNMGYVFDNLEYAPSAHFVDLYVNGEYYGNYLLTEQIQVNKGRVDIKSEAGVVGTGYLLEYDFHIDNDEIEGVDYFRIRNKNSVYFVKSPDRSDGLTDDQFNFIKEYITLTDRAIMNRQYYNNYIDIDTFIDFFWMQEIFKNIDCNQGSIYMYKESGGLLKMGPIWDFDLSAGDDGQDYNAVKTDGWFSFLSYKNEWWYTLMKDKEVANKFANRWHEKYEEILEVIEMIPDTYEYIEASANRNFELYDNVIGEEWSWYTVDAIYNIKTYEGQVEYLYNWLKDRVEWINNNVDSLR